MSAERVFISLGSNMGDRAANIEQAIRLFTESGVRIRARSTLYETEPVGVLDQPLFLNQVIEVEGTIEPRDLLALCMKVEDEMGRVRARRHGPRVIDCDLILYGRRIVSDSDLVIPHPRLHERGFVLIPLADIAPDTVHPVLGKSVKELAERTNLLGSVHPWLKGG